MMMIKRMCPKISSLPYFSTQFVLVGDYW